MPNTPANDLRLLLDENISPNICPRLFEAGIDAVPLRDRSLLRIADHTVLQLAQKEGRAVATINEADFAKLVSRKATHFGIATIPSGKTRDEQYELLALVANYLRTKNKDNPMAAMQDNIISVNDMLEINSRIVRAHPAPVTLLRAVAANKPAG